MPDDVDLGPLTSPRSMAGDNPITNQRARERSRRQFRVRFKDGTEEFVWADSLDEAWQKARRSARKQISTRQQGHKVVDDVKRSDL